MSVAELLATHSSAELTEWIAYEQIAGTIGQARDDLLMAMLAATVSNANRGKGRKAKVSDFLPKWDRGGRRHMDWTEMLAAVKTMNRSMGGRDLTKEGQPDGADSGRAPR
ncbi:phage tail assembly protein T [Streptomyces goshikiensis]